MPNYTDKAQIRDYYDKLTPYFQELWGDHLHHGYWTRGDETKEQAQVQLIEHLAETAGIRPGMKILDAGCGFGTTSIHLAKHYAAEVTGITISPVQVDMAKQAAAREKADVKFLLMDAEAMTFEEPFDLVWSVESISHYPNKDRFFSRASQLLKSGGTLAIIDWFKGKNLTPRDVRTVVEPIQKGMLVELETTERYEERLSANGFETTRSEVLNDHSAKSWDIGVGLLKQNSSLWRIAAEHGTVFVNFLKSFRAMKAGFHSGQFVYALIVATKI
jgi:tocopherol O-methyltransferase